MVEVLRSHLNRQGKGGGQCKLSVEDQLLLCWNQAIPHPKNDTVVVLFLLSGCIGVESDRTMDLRISSSKSEVLSPELKILYSFRLDITCFNA